MNKREKRINTIISIIYPNYYNHWNMKNGIEKLTDDKLKKLFLQCIKNKRNEIHFKISENKLLDLLWDINI